MPVARQQFPNTYQWTNWEAVFSTQFVRQLSDATIELLESVFSMRFAPRSYGQAKSKSFFFVIILSGVRLSPLGTAATTDLLYQPQMIDDGDYGEIVGMKIGRENRSTRRKPAPPPIVHHKSHMTRPGLEPGPPRWEASD
jgi:hypothetical protein